MQLPFRWAALLASMALLTSFASKDSPRAERRVNTFSIVAFDPVTGDLGVAVQSKFLAVGHVVPYARAGVGAVATQAYVNTSYGPESLKRLERGDTPEAVIRLLTEADTERDRRQVGIVDAHGRASAFTGQGTDAWAGHRIGRNFCVQGNLLAGESVLAEMARAYTAMERETEGDLPHCLLAALQAGQAAGGDRRGQQSAALLVAREAGGYGGMTDRFIDLRVDDHPQPIEELRRVYEQWERTFGRQVRERSAARFEQNGNRRAADLERRRARFAAGMAR